jgi:hypothetical protein
MQQERACWWPKYLAAKKLPHKADLMWMEVLIILTIENMDPMGIHTEIRLQAPAMTLSDTTFKECVIMLY